MSNSNRLSNLFERRFSPSSRSTKHNKFWLTSEKPSNVAPPQLFAMNIADMDFGIDPRIKKRFLERVSECSDFTYKSFDADGGNSTQLAIQQWYRLYRNVQISTEWLRDCPSVAQAFVITLLAMTKQQDSVLIITPVYKKLIEAVNQLKRTCVISRMIKSKGRYELDIKDIVSKIPKVRVVVMVNPHNPTGRLFSKKEVQPIIDAVAASPIKTIYFSDEIFADLALGKFESALSYGLPDEQIVVADSISKAFNTQSIQGGYSIVPGKHLRNEYKRWQQLLRVSHTEPAMLMVEVCYSPDIGPSWLMEIKSLIQHNFSLAKDFIEKFLPKLVFSKPQGNYLMVLDFGNYVASKQQLHDALWCAGLVGEPLDAYYGENTFSTSQIRINLAVPADYLLRMLTSLYRQISKFPTSKL